MPKIGECMNLWRKLENKSQSWKNEATAFKKRQKKEWKKGGELKGIRTVDKRFIKK
jgi:hypothetical protein